MLAQYIVKSTHWAGNRYSVTDASGREIYTIRVRGSTSRFYPAGAEEPRFEVRSSSFFGWEKKFVESAVDYIFGYFKPKAMGKEGYEIFDVAKNPIGVFRPGAKKPSEIAEVARAEGKLKGRAALREALEQMMEAALARELVANDKVIARFQIAKNRREVTVTVLDQMAKNFDERVILILSLHSLRIQNNGGG